MALSACGGAPPQVHVIGVAAKARHPSSRPDTVVMFVEVVNPTGRNLQLQRLEYQFAAPSWFSASGDLPLSRAIGANAAAVIEVPVRVTPGTHGPAADRDVPYQLQGRLYAFDDRLERSWEVTATGVIQAADVKQANLGLSPIRLRVAGSP